MMGAIQIGYPESSLHAGDALLPHGCGAGIGLVIPSRPAKLAAMPEEGVASKLGSDESPPAAELTDEMVVAAAEGDPAARNSLASFLSHWITTLIDQILSKEPDSSITVHVREIARDRTLDAIFRVPPDRLGTQLNIRTCAGLRAWVRTIVTSKIDDARSLASMRGRRETLDLDRPINQSDGKDGATLCDYTPSASLPPDKLALLNELGVLVREVMAESLHPKEQALLMMRAEGYMPAEIASEMGIDAGVVSTRINRIRAKLMAALRRKGIA